MGHAVEQTQLVTMCVTFTSLSLRFLSCEVGRRLCWSMTPYLQFQKCLFLSLVQTYLAAKSDLN